MTMYSVILYESAASWKKIRPIGQAVKTSPFHGGNTGSIPVWVIVSLANKKRGVAQFG